MSQEQSIPDPKKTAVDRRWAAVCVPWRYRVATAELPGEVKTLIAGVVRRTRLWRREKSAVAAELVAHFRDALAAGESPADAIGAFGDVETTARLIRRAKRRNRSLLWKACTWGVRGVAVVTVAYVGLCVYFFAGRPVIKVDYAAQLNADIDRIPPAERAWPVYQKLLDHWAPPTAKHRRSWNSWVYAEPGYGEWGPFKVWVKSQQNEIEQLRQATRLPSFGMPFVATAPLLTGTPVPASVAEQQVTAVSDVQTFARLLAGDANVAVDLGDADRALADVLAIDGLANQLGREPLPVFASLMTLGIREQAAAFVERQLIDRPGFFNDAQLAQLAACFPAGRTAADVCNLAGERLAFLDTVQRSFTDDGHGDGRVTAAGGDNLSFGFNGLVSEANLATTAALPLVSLGADTRKALTDGYEPLVVQAEADLARPLRDVDPQPRADLLASSQFGSGHDGRMVTTLGLGLFSLQSRAEGVLGMYDGLACGIALERYRLAHGKYPADLNALVPALLPAVPADRIDGQPVSYRLHGGRPLVYSVGVDRDDDNGRLPLGFQASFESAARRYPTESLRPTPDGDWLLFCRRLR